MQVRNLEKVKMRLRRAEKLPSYDLRVYVRRPSRNEVIAKAQAKAGRNPFFRTRAEDRVLKEELRSIMTGMLDAGEVTHRMNRLAQDLARNVQAHIYERLSSKVSVSNGQQTAALSPAYAKRKREMRRLGQVLSVTPELIATGEFVESIRGKAVKR